MRQINFPTWSPAVDVTIAKQGQAIDARTLSRASAQCVVAGATSPVGTCKLQGSNDKLPLGGQQPAFTPTNWSDIPNATIAVNANGVFLVPSTDIGYTWIRAVWVPTSGSLGTVVVTGNAQGWT